MRVLKRSFILVITLVVALFGLAGCKNKEVQSISIDTTNIVLQINEGEQFELPTCSFVAPNGQEFAGWTVGETLYQPGEKLTVTADVVVNATWKDVQEVEPEVEPQTEPEVEPKPEEPAKEEEEQSEAVESVNKLKDIIKQIFDAILNFFRSLFAGSAE